MHLAQYLQHHGQHLDAVLKIVETHLGDIHADDILFVSGSLTLGLGNIYSDLDLFLITERDLSDQAAFAQAVTLHVGPILMDVEFISPHQIDDILNRLRLTYQQSLTNDARKSLDISARELDFLHRLLTGVAVTNPTEFSITCNKVDATMLCAISHTRAAIIAANEHQDLVGFLHERDYASARFAGQRLLDATMDCTLAALGNTMVKDKWRIKMAERLATPGWDAALPGGKLSMSLATSYLALQDWGSTALDIRKHACRITHFANRLIPWAQRKMMHIHDAHHLLSQHHIHVPQHPECSISSPTSSPDTPLPTLASHVMIRYQDKQLYAISRAQPIAVCLNTAAHEMLSCFDGITNREMIAKQISRHSTSTSTTQILEYIDYLEHFLYAIGFLDLT